MTAPFRYLVGALNNKKVVGLKQLDEPSHFSTFLIPIPKQSIFSEIDKYLTRSKDCFTRQKHLFPNYIKYPTYHWSIEITSITDGIGTSCPSEASEFTPSFLLGSCSSIFRFSTVFCR